jgi:Fe2+ transport system protein B
MIIALAGKSKQRQVHMLFNQTYGSNQHDWEFSGVTVEQKSGFIRPP